MTCRRGDIVLVLFPDSNLRTSKRRPALIVQADNLGADLPQTVVTMITSNMACAGHPSPVTVPVDGKAANGWGLLMDSVVVTDNLATIRHSDIDRVIRVHSVMTEVYAALRTTFGLRLPDSYDDVSESRIQIRDITTARPLNRLAESSAPDAADPGPWQPVPLMRAATVDAPRQQIGRLDPPERNFREKSELFPKTPEWVPCHG